MTDLNEIKNLFPYFPSVYYVESSKPRNLLAINPRLTNDRIEWSDTSRGSSVTIDKILFTPEITKTNKQIPKKIEVVTKEGEKITLTYLTVQLYNEKIRDRVVGQIQFDNDKDLQDYYMNTNFDLY